jgi:hypothetical protein
MRDDDNNKRLNLRLAKYIYLLIYFFVDAAHIR